MLDEYSLLKTMSNFYYVEKEAIPFEPLLLSVNDHGAIEDIAVMISYKIPSDIFCCLTCI
jgi:hypothetical protein